MRGLGVALFIVTVLVGIFAVREVLMSRDEPLPSGSAMEIVVDLETRNPVEPHTMEDMGYALFLRCQLEVATLPRAFEPLGGGRYRLTVAPSLGEHDQRQIEGCLQDTVIPRLKAEVVRMRPADGSAAEDGPDPAGSVEDPADG